MSEFYPGEIVTLKNKDFRIVATNHEGKLILVPSHVKESITDMTMRLQSTRPVEPSDFDPKKV